MAFKAKAKTLVLFHHYHDHDDKILDRMAGEAIEAAAGSQTEVLMGRDGMTIDV